MELLLAAGAAGLASYAIGKRRERNKIANGYVTYRENPNGGEPYGHIHYGKTARHNGQGYHQQTGYYNTYTR